MRDTLKLIKPYIDGYVYYKGFYDDIYKALPVFKATLKGLKLSKRARIEINAFLLAVEYASHTVKEYKEANNGY